MIIIIIAAVALVAVVAWKVEARQVSKAVDARRALRPNRFAGV